MKEDKIPTIKLFNTATGEKENLSPIVPGEIKMYTCGPTVYDYAHIGNFRTYIFEDILRRTLKFFGFKVTQVMNLTDVDDKTIKGAIAQGYSLDEYTDQYKRAFFDDISTLNIETVEAYPAATDYIDDMIRMIETLLKKKYAYKSKDNSIYYSIKKFPKYGCLSHLNMDDLQVNASTRISGDEYDKEYISDFVLWKSYNEHRDGGLYWDSPFGPGRPGWHLECSTMAMKLLGETIDIHVGGVDNIFPHHENEIAQSEACSEKTFANVWMHAEHLIVDGKKMSKSLGNFYTLRDLLDRKYSSMQVRYMLLQTHYKTPLNFTLEGLKAAGHALDRLNTFIDRMLKIKTRESSHQVDDLIRNTKQQFLHALSDDLNISSALASIFDLIRAINTLSDANRVSQDDALAILDILKSFNSVLGAMSFKSVTETLPEEIEQALQKREKARKDKNWALSDKLRDYIINEGYHIEDTPTGTVIKPKN